MARAVVPILSPSCGSTRITIGPPSIQVLVLSVPDPGMPSHLTLQDCKALATQGASNIIRPSGSTAPAPRSVVIAWKSALQDGLSRAIRAAPRGPPGFPRLAGAQKAFNGEDQGGY